MPTVGPTEGHIDTRPMVVEVKREKVRTSYVGLLIGPRVQVHTSYSNCNDPPCA
jgi:hypothetical protein